VRSAALAISLLSLFAPLQAPAAELVAQRMLRANTARLQVGGPDSIAGVGDWALRNGTLCAAVADLDHGTVLSPRGGVLVDLGHCGRADDHFVLLQPLFNFSRGNVPPASEIRAEVSHDEARIVTSGALRGIHFETTYSLDREDPERLRVVSTLERSGPGFRLSVFGDVLIHGTGSLLAFTAHTREPELSIGYQHPPVDPNNALTMARAIRAADLQVAVAGAEPGIAYGAWRAPSWIERSDGSRHELPSLAINGKDFTILGVFANPFRVGGGRIGLLELAQLPLMDLAKGERLVFERWILVGERADVASVTDRVWADAPRIHGRVDDASARIAVFREDGTPATEVQPDARGRFSVRLPAGRYEMTARSPDGRSQTRALSVGAERDQELGVIALGAPAMLVLPAVAPARLVFRGVDGTPDPLLESDGIDLRFGDVPVYSSPEANQIFLGGLPGDPREVVVPPGRYRVLATRGPEFDLTETIVDASAGRRTRIELSAPARVLTTPGWVSADLHVHAEPSDDSSQPMERQLAAFLAEGADVIVSTDHDRISDFGPLAAELGVAGRIASLVGSEVTTTVMGEETPWTAGHYNVFPLRRDPLAYQDGTPPHEGRRLRSVIGDLRESAPEALVQINHPRGPTRANLSFFTHLSVGGELDRTLPLGHRTNRSLVEPEPARGVRDLDFHAMELLNGSSMLRYRLTRADWLSLLLQGEFRTATANSDTHNSRETIALPRNLVALSRTRPFDQTRFLHALRKGRVCGTTGPLLDVDLDGAGPGERSTAPGGELRIGVRAAPWVPVARARVFVNGDRVAERRIAPGEELRIPLTFARDAFVFVEVDGEPGELYRQVAPGFTPFAFCNPIFVDADGDGTWTPPGLPVTPPAAISAPDSVW